MIICQAAGVHRRDRWCVKNGVQSSEDRALRAVRMEPNVAISNSLSICDEKMLHGPSR